MNNQKTKKEKKGAVPHEAIILSKIVSEKKTISITLIDGEELIDQLRWYTNEAMGLQNGKCVYKSAIKYWETIGE